MAEVSRLVSHTTRVRRRNSIIWLIAVVCLGGVVLSLIVRLGIEFTTPSLPHRLLFEQDIPLPGAFPDTYRTPQHPFAPGLAVLFDHFDFQALDPQTHLMFIAHSGPAPDREQQVNPNFNPDTDAKTDGNIVVFDTRQYRVVGLLNIPQVAGVVVAPDLLKVYAADANDNIIYAIDERTLKIVYVGCGVGVSVFQEEGRNLKWLGNYIYGINTHTIAVNEETHEIYLPLTRVGNRPVLRIMRYNANAID